MGENRDQSASSLRVLIVAENASENFGGEAVLPLHYFRFLRDRGMAAWLITHARVRQELQASMPNELDRIFFIEDSALHRLLWRLGSGLTPRLRYVTTDFISRLITQRAQLRLARRLIRQHGIDVVHQPTPVSPREPSLLFDMGAPVVIGPMNGGIDYPPAFRDHESRATRTLIGVGRAWAYCLSLVFPGKRRAAVLLVANERSRRALVRGSTKAVFNLPENGVDTSAWCAERTRRDNTAPCRFVFVGRLIRSKGVDLWLRAFKMTTERGCCISGLVIGDGPEREVLMAQARSEGLLASRPDEPGKVFFAGWKPRSELAEMLAGQDCLVFPTLCECGGAVALEAMAAKLPVVATKWGGPMDYVDSSCGVLISPDSREHLISGFADAMMRLARDPELRERMGRAGRRKVEQSFSWTHKVDTVIGYYRRAAQTAKPCLAFATVLVALAAEFVVLEA